MLTNTLSAFVEWAEITRKYLSKATLSEIKINQPCENSSVNLELENHEKIGRITFWESTDGHAEIIDVETEVVIYEKFLKDILANDLDNHFSEFVEFFK